MLLLSLYKTNAQESCNCNIDVGAPSTSTYISTLSWSNPLNNACHRIFGTLVIDEDFTINNGYLQMMPGSAIIISPGVTLVLNGINSLGGIHACDTMWRGITLNSTASLVMNDCHIRDAQYAIQCRGKAALTLTDNYFDRNYISIYAPPPAFSSTISKPIVSVEISGNTFTCDNTLLAPFSGQSPTPDARGFAAILLYNATFTLGSNSQNHVNVIRLLQNGIVAYRSSLNVYDTQISALTPQATDIADELQIYPGAGPDGHGIYVDQHTVLNAYNNTMSELRRGIHGQFSSVVASSNTIEECVHGIVSLSPDHVTIASGNTISFQERGIHIQYVNTCNQIEVTGNNLSGYYEFSAFANNLGDGIYINSIPGACILAPDISDNHIEISNKFLGIAVGQVPQPALVDDNTVEFVSDESPVVVNTGGGQVQVPPSGISLGLTDLVRARHNMVDVTAEEAYFGEGITVGNSTNATVCDNTVDWLDRGMTYFSMCDNAIIRLNHFGDHDAGLYYYNGTMTGIQDNQGNQWDGSGGTAHNFSSMFYQDLSRYFIEDCPNQPDWPPSFDPAQSNCQNLITDWFFSQTGTTPANCTQNPSPDALTDNDILTATGALDTLSSGSGLVWEAKRHLFRKLTDYPGLLEENGDVEDFYVEHEGSNLEKFNDIDNAVRALYVADAAYWTHFNTRDAEIDAALAQLRALDSLYALATTELQKEAINEDRTDWTDSLDLAYLALSDSVAFRDSLRLTLVAGIQGMNDGVEPDNVLEENEKIVNDVYLATAASNMLTLDSAQIAQLTGVAGQCPLTGGKAVYRARYLLRLSVATEFSDDDLCEGERGQKPAKPSGSISVRPNPAYDRIQIAFGATTGDYPAHIRITSISGQVMLQNALAPNQDVAHLNIAHLPSGLYICTVNSETHTLFTQKIAVFR